MNERIKLLAEQAGYLPDNFGIGHWDMPECKKFAELIILECMDIAHTHTPQTEECEYQWLIHNKIKEHFGVEE
jgi:hypothetical protein